MNFQRFGRPSLAGAAALSLGVLAGCGAASDAGVFLSTDAGQSFVSSSVLDVESSFADVSVAALGISQQGPVYAGLIDAGLVLSPDGGVSWQSTPLVEGSVRAIAFNADGSEAYMAYEQQVIVTRDGGATFDTLYSGPEVLTTLAVDRESPTTLYAGSFGGQLVRSTNGGRTWNELARFNGTITDVLPSPISEAVAVAVDAELLIAEDGVNFAARTPTLPQGPRAAGDEVEVLTLAQSAQVGSSLLAAGSDGLFASSDLGLNWTSVAEPLSAGKSAILDVAVAADNSSQVVIVGGTTVAKSDDGGQTWLTRGIATGRNVGVIAIVNPGTLLVGVAGEAKSFIQQTLGN